MLTLPMMLTAALLAQEADETGPAADSHLPLPVRQCLEALDDPEYAPEGQVQAARYLVRRYATGLEPPPPEVVASCERFSISALTRIAADEREAARVRAGAAAMLARVAPSEQVKSLLLQAFVMHLDRMPWRKRLFEDVVQMRFVEVLPFVEEYVDRYRDLSREELRTARYEYPLGDALLLLARLGGDAELDRIRPFLAPGTPSAIRYRAIEAVEALTGPESLAALEEISVEGESTAFQRRYFEVLAARGSLRGVDGLIELAGREAFSLDALRRIANRPFQDAAEARAWRESLDGTSLEQSVLEGFREAGFDVPDVSDVGHLEALLRVAATADADFLRHNAWRRFVRLTSVDASAGEFWSHEDGILTPYERRPRSDEAAARVRERQLGFCDAAYTWLESVRDRLRYDPSEGRFVIASEGP